MSAQTMRLRIESDGTSMGTRVTDVETGRVLPAQAVTWTIDLREQDPRAAHLATATIVVPLVQVSAEAVAEHAALDGALYFTMPAVSTQ
jgi:hypothetical protein